MEAERWLPLPFPGYEAYQVSDRGRLRGRTGKFLRLSVKRGWGGGAYLYVHLHNGRQESRCWYVHRLVWAVFSGGGAVPDGYDVHHKDGDHYNNRLDNLELALSDGHRGHRNYRPKPEPVAEGCVA